MMRLEALYPGVMDKEIAAYVPACQTEKWRGVTFRHVLNMTSGNYDSSKYMHDEESQKMADFFNESYHANNIDLACSMFKHRSKPGKKWVYHTSDTYILGTAMQNFLAEASSKNSDIYQDLIVRPLWLPLKLNPVTGDTLRTDDIRRQAFTGYGLTFYRDDIAKIATMLLRGSGKLTSLLDQTAFAEVFQNSWQETAGKEQNLDYKNGFWTTTFKQIGDCNKPIQVPFMSGYGGITVALLPNNIVYYYFSDNNDFIWQEAITAAHQIEPFNCQ
jgi:CubicO group peptidase (beta-lactamase class C family)